MTNDLVAGSAHDQGWSGAAEAVVLHGLQHGYAVFGAQLGLQFVAVGGEQASELVDGLAHLAHAGTEGLPVDSGLVELPLHVPGADADLETSAGEDVGGGDVAGQHGGVPERRVEHQGADPQVFGGLRSCHQGGDAEVVGAEKRVVAEGFDVAAGLGELGGRAEAVDVRGEAEVGHAAVLSLPDAGGAAVHLGRSAAEFLYSVYSFSVN
ncbi:hypothetical protein GCM10009854_32170 [Saccharopolyspora halophila]|uniref:Uncharacterized protein n=1 Tax=Saccharopolyspora halophila TaxID=405551 RepID=A0ABN3GI37_9PSEU